MIQQGDPMGRFKVAGARRFTSIALISYLVLARMPLLAQTGSLTCSSEDGSYHYCRANTQNSVQLTRQLPGPRCQQNYSWGFDYRGIWVDRGCSAQFSFGQAQRNDDVGTAVAVGILGAIVLGAVAAGSSSDDHHDQQATQRDYYSDGYRMGQRDWDANRPPYYLGYRNRFPPEYERDFAAGYDAGYNNRRNQGFRDMARVPAMDPNRGTINNPGHGVSGVEPQEKVITCSDNSGNGAHCNAITYGGVDLVRQRSGSPCIQDQTWGVDNSGIWVSHGCRADFVLHGVAAN
jgi:hypothetical protein